MFAAIPGTDARGEAWVQRPRELKGAPEARLQTFLRRHRGWPLAPPIALQLSWSIARSVVVANASYWYRRFNPQDGKTRGTHG